MNERGLVEVPEDALGDDALAFGLTAVQLGICGLAVLAAVVLNLLPLWLPLRLLLMLAVSGAIALVAVLPVSGQPAYRWLRLAVHHAQGRRTWRASLMADKSQISVPSENDELSQPVTETGRLAPVAAIQRKAMADTSEVEPEIDRLPLEVASPDPPASVGEARFQLRLVPRQVDDELALEPLVAQTHDREERVAPIPHVLQGLRIVTFVSFAGGVGKSTLAVEAASYVAARARYRTLDGQVRALRVLLLDASRVTAGAVGLRLGLDANAHSLAASAARWHAPSAVEELVVPTRCRVDVALVPAHPMTLGPELAPEPDRRLFEADHVDEFLDGARDVGYQLVIADLGSHLEEGQRHLIDRSDVIVGVIRPTLGSLPDVHRLVAVIRGMGAGRKLVLVANMADDDAVVRTHADEYGVRIGTVVPSNPAFLVAEERGEPAWRLDSSLERPIRALASLAWPLLREDEEVDRDVGLFASVRRVAHLRGRAR